MDGYVIYLNGNDDIIEISFADCDKITNEVKARIGKWSCEYTAGDIRQAIADLVDEYVCRYCVETWDTFMAYKTDESYCPNNVINAIMDDIKVTIQ